MGPTQLSFPHCASHMCLWVSACARPNHTIWHEADYAAKEIFAWPVNSRQRELLVVVSHEARRPLYKSMCDLSLLLVLSPVRCPGQWNPQEHEDCNSVTEVQKIRHVFCSKCLSVHLAWTCSSVWHHHLHIPITQRMVEACTKLLEWNTLFHFWGIYNVKRMPAARQAYKKHDTRWYNMKSSRRKCLCTFKEAASHLSAAGHEEKMHWVFEVGSPLSH